MFNTRATRRNPCWSICINACSIFTIATVLFLWYESHETRRGYLATPFIQPWFPAIWSSYRANVPVTSQSKENNHPFLSEFKNPCYLKRNEESIIGSTLAQSESDRKSKLSYPARVQIVDENGVKTNDVLRCLPRYFVLGFAKSGTTDLSAKMMAHPYILRAPLKEPAWFNNHRFHDNEDFSPLSSYIDYYDFWVTQRMANYFHRYGPEVPLIVGDHSTHTIDIYRYGDSADRNFHYNNQSAPTGSTGPDTRVLKEYSSPILVKQLVPHAKFIIIMRDPVARLFSLYRMHEAVSHEDFHDGIVEGIKFWKKCVDTDKRPIGECMYYKLNKGEDKVANKESTWRTRAIGSVRRGIYYHYLAEWFAHFKREQFLVIKFENYARNSSGILNNQVFPHLGLPKLSGFNEISMNLRSQAAVSRSRPKASGVAVQKWTQGDMQPETKKLLRDFYAPYNKKLADWLGDPDFNWSYD